jgi:CHASE2 domain-containing sensor protein
VIPSVRRVGIAIGSLVAASLVILLVGSWIPPILGSLTNPVAALILGGLIYQDILRRSPRPTAQTEHAGP